MNQGNSEAEPIVAVARVVKTKGLKGELAADLLTDFPERFADISRLICVAANGERSEVQLESYSFQKRRVILKLSGVDSITGAAALVGCQFAVPEVERVRLPAGQFYDWELEGCLVETVTGRSVGLVSGILRGCGVDTLVVQDEQQRDYLVPMAEPIIVKVDIANKSISIDPPQGLLEL